MKGTLPFPAPASRVEDYVRERRREGKPVRFDLGCGGHKVADAVVILGSFDIVMGEVDR